MEPHSETNVEFDFRILTNLPHQYYFSSTLDFYDEKLPYPEILVGGKLQLTIPNRANSAITKNDKFTIKVIFYKVPDIFTLKNKNLLSPSLRKKCF